MPINLVSFGNPIYHLLCKVSCVSFLLDFQQQAYKFIASPVTGYVFIAYKRL